MSDYRTVRAVELLRMVRIFTTDAQKFMKMYGQKVEELLRELDELES